MVVPYVDGGRDMNGLDCWGLDRLVKHHQYQLPLMTSFGHVSPDNKPELTKAFKNILPEFIPVKPEIAATAAGFRGNLLLHVGVCVEVNNQLRILETSKRHGVSLSSIKDFKRKYTKVEFYKYVGNA
jgi:hypothetical protein